MPSRPQPDEVESGGYRVETGPVEGTEQLLGAVGHQVATQYRTAKEKGDIVDAAH